jgi:hypothetical protein
MVERVTHGIVKRWELRPDLWTSDDPPLDYDESFGSVTPYIKPTADAKKERRRTYIREYMRARRAVAKSIFGTVVD